MAATDPIATAAVPKPARKRAPARPYRRIPVQKLLDRIAEYEKRIKLNASRTVLYEDRLEHLKHEQSMRSSADED